MPESNIRLYCGDCITVMHELIQEDIKVDMVLTDPPYGTTACKWDRVIPFEEMWGGGAWTNPQEHTHTTVRNRTIQ